MTQHATLTVTVSARKGMKIALVLLWHSLVAWVHRTSVTFEAGQDTK
jgi:hypothetical protein